MRDVTSKEELSTLIHESLLDKWGMSEGDVMKWMVGSPALPPRIDNVRLNYTTKDCRHALLPSTYTYDMEEWKGAAGVIESGDEMDLSSLLFVPLLSRSFALSSLMGEEMRGMFASPPLSSPSLVDCSTRGGGAACHESLSAIFNMMAMKSADKVYVMNEIFIVKDDARSIHLYPMKKGQRHTSTSCPASVLHPLLVSLQRTYNTYYRPPVEVGGKGAGVAGLRIRAKLTGELHYLSLRLICMLRSMRETEGGRDHHVEIGGDVRSDFVNFVTDMLPHTIKSGGVSKVERAEELQQLFLTVEKSGDGEDTARFSSICTEVREEGRVKKGSLFVFGQNGQQSGGGGSIISAGKPKNDPQQRHQLTNAGIDTTTGKPFREGVTLRLEGLEVVWRKGQWRDTETGEARLPYPDAGMPARRLAAVRQEEDTPTFQVEEGSEKRGEMVEVVKELELEGEGGE
eukprot:CAMPEP_0113915078 /NCGR_PEP_ID=MMETSP0780_2-20120614/30955_1 /TAXON_ID=652834 /ORGANISM="Palpitomonas bilix" /LENGTH=456 /DNA_ID=CAMNT_0000913453 /DNA_START=288 /DNA_END=1658 /DNA_ORIENTATION=- /assembly_acc=CAM_ASM_000599